MASGGSYPQQQQQRQPQTPVFRTQGVSPAHPVDKKRKCISCQNTVLARCDFRCCGVCCVKAKNQCSIHDLTRMQQPQQHQQQQQQQQQQYYGSWTTPAAGMPYQHMNPAMMAQRFSPGVGRMQMPVPPLTPAQLEAQRAQEQERARKNYINGQKEALMVNSWRLLRMKDYDDAEVAFEDEAFDRYTSGARWLEEVLLFDGQSYEGSIGEYVKEEERVVDGLRARQETDSKKKDIRRQKLQKAVSKSIQKLKKGETEMENMLEIHEFNQVGISRRDMKRMKIQTADGMECLKRINACEDLFQRIQSTTTAGAAAEVSNAGEDIVCGLLDTYKDTFGHELGNLIPRLSEDSSKIPSEIPEDSIRKTVLKHLEMKLVDADRLSKGLVCREVKIDDANFEKLVGSFSFQDMEEAL